MCLQTSVSTYSQIIPLWLSVVLEVGWRLHMFHHHDIQRTSWDLSCQAFFPSGNEWKVSLKLKRCVKSLSNSMHSLAKWFGSFRQSQSLILYCRFWLAVQDLKRMPQQDVAQRVQDIWAEFLAEGAPSSINLDSHSYERTSQNLKDPGRYSYEDAQVSKRRTQEERRSSNAEV